MQTLHEDKDVLVAVQEFCPSVFLPVSIVVDPVLQEFCDLQVCVKLVELTVSWALWSCTLISVLVERAPVC